MHSDVHWDRAQFDHGTGISRRGRVGRAARNRRSTRHERTIRPDPGTGCKTYADLAVRFPDGSLKRPDIAVFYRQPDEMDEAVTLLPEAVIEVVSRGSEVKDLELNPSFYRRHGIPDIVVFNPYNQEVRHYTTQGLMNHVSPVELRLECGCLVTV